MNHISPTPSNDAIAPVSSRGLRLGKTSASAIAAAAAVAGLAVGGVTLGSSLASASTDAPAPAPAPEASETPEAAPVDDSSVEVLDEGEFGEVFGEYGDLFREFDECLAAELPGLFEMDEIGEGGEVGEIAEFDLPDSVSLYSSDDDSVSFYDFGEGDGEITFSKIGDEITVEVDGDVERFDEHEFIDVPLDEIDGDVVEVDGDFELDPAFEAAYEQCGDLLPADLTIEPMVEALPAESIDG